MNLNNTVQVDFFFLLALPKSSILCLSDVSTAFSATQVLRSRELCGFMKAIEHILINVHGPTQHISTEPEIFSNFATEINYFGIAFKLISTRRHSKLGAVERKNSRIRLLARRLLYDSSHAVEVHG